jgi:hypothetical protein
MSRFNQQWQDDEDEEEGPDGDDDFDYDEFVENEFGETAKRSQYSPLIRYTTIVLLAIFVASVVLQFWG